MSADPPSPAERRRVALAMLAAALAAAAAFWPALQAGITPEDFGWLTAARQLPTPWPLLGGNVFFVYFYRPVPLLLWWLAAQAFGVNALAHNAVDLCVHALAAALLARLAWRLSGRAVAAWAAGLAFACLPCAGGTALWMSDRFDPVALVFGLAALLAFERRLREGRGALAGGVLLTLALLSKETAFAISGALLLRVAWRAWHRRERDASLWLAVLLPPLLALTLRALSGTATDTSLPIADAPAAFVVGVLAWWQRLPAALVGFAPLQWPQGLVLAGAAILSGAGIRHIVAPPRQGLALLAATGLLLVLAAPPMQWPITRLALAPAVGYDATVNLRFYYLAAAGLALLWSAAVAGAVGGSEWAEPQRIGRWRYVLLLGIGIGLAGIAWQGTHALGERWTARYGADAARNLVLAQALAAHDWPAGCRIVLDAPAFDDDFRTHADVIAKVSAAPGASLLRCAVFAGTPVYTTIVDGAQCEAAAWPGLTIAVFNGAPVRARLGPLCTLQFAAPPAADEARAIRVRVGADGNVFLPASLSPPLPSP